MTPLSEESKKRLTKYMDGCAHIWVRDGHVSHHTCSECGEELSVRKEFLPKMRSFTTGNDMLDLLAKLHENGKLSSFLIWLQDEHGYDWLGWEADSVETRVSHIDNYIKIMRKEISNGRSITQQT